MRVKFLLIRHSLSCSNLLRQHAYSFRKRRGCAIESALRDQSQKLRDPGLTALGRKMADTYGPSFRKKVVEAGFDLSAATIGSSSLRRAKETAALLFPAKAEQLVVFPHLSEHGNIPENTPSEHRLTKPGWQDFLKHIHARFSGKATTAEPIQVIAVSHNGYLSDIWEELTGCGVTFDNLDAFVLEGELDSQGKLTTAAPVYIQFTGIPPTRRRQAKDYCPLPVVKATRRKTRKIKRRSQ